MYRYESAFSMKPEERYTAGLGLGRKSSWDTLTENTVEDITTISNSDTATDKSLFTFV